LLTKYFQVLFSEKYQTRNKVINMNLKGRPFDPIGDSSNPMGGEGPRKSLLVVSQRCKHRKGINYLF